MQDKLYSMFTDEVSVDEIWQLVTDVDHWNQWDFNIEYSSMEGNFSVGKSIAIKSRLFPQSGIAVFDSDECQKSIVYLLVFPLSDFFISYFYKEVENGVKITVTLAIQGILSPFWYLIYGRNIAKNFPEDIKIMIDETKSRKHKKIFINRFTE
ncbi:SRPBCC family protein [Chryseobacterium populi]|uniref:Polyketide cyclase / dehydrase and lipid transport n=1 Tax=Chryseobacterium populi TaxID=1144316 RepID=J3CC96_9FLAO|nr:hypothetical protein [Chryseobacterium populi]EJL68714.1 hypothetical protein PMI13_03540 [Chryseobacterium populi]